MFKCIYIYIILHAGLSKAYIYMFAWGMKILRNDKYSKKVYKYFVEYADKKAKKKSHTEIERHSTQQEACNILLPFNLRYLMHTLTAPSACLHFGFVCLQFSPKAPFSTEPYIYIYRYIYIYVIKIMCCFEAGEVDLSGTKFLGKVAEDANDEEQPLRAQTPEEGEPLV